MTIFAACSAAFFALTGSPFVMAAMGYSGADIGQVTHPKQLRSSLVVTVVVLC